MRSTVILIIISFLISSTLSKISHKAAAAAAVPVTATTTPSSSTTPASSASTTTSTSSPNSTSSSSTSDEAYWIYSFCVLTLAFVILITFLVVKSCYKCLEDERSSVRSRFRGGQGADQQNMPPPTYYAQQNEGYPPHQDYAGGRGYGGNLGEPRNVNPLERPYMDRYGETKPYSNPKI